MMMIRMATIGNISTGNISTAAIKPISIAESCNSMCAYQQHVCIPKCLNKLRTVLSSGSNLNNPHCIKHIDVCWDGPGLGHCDGIERVNSKRQ
jgi:hypothetical protein